MKRLIAPLLALGALALLATVRPGLPPTAHAQVPPTRFFGTVFMDGNPAPGGTEVKAFVNDNQCGVTTTKDDGTYVLDVAHDATLPGCGGDGAEVRFTVAGIDVDSRSTFDTGAFVPMDLSVSTGGGAAAPSDTPPTDQPPTDQPPPDDQPPPPSDDMPSE